MIETKSGGSLTLPVEYKHKPRYFRTADSPSTSASQTPQLTLRIVKPKCPPCFPHELQHSTGASLLDCEENFNQLRTFSDNEICQLLSSESNCTPLIAETD